MLESLEKMLKNVSKHPKVCWKNVLECAKNVGNKLKKSFLKSW